MQVNSENEIAMARAVGRGDWKRVIELGNEALKTSELKQYDYSMIGYAYEQLKDFAHAKEYYGQAISIDAYNEQALEGLARVYALEKNYDLAYQYVLKGLYQTKSEEFKVPGFLKLLIAVVIKVIRPSRSFKDIRMETEEMDKTRSKWVEWAEGYKDWYESNFQNTDKPQIH